MAPRLKLDGATLAGIYFGHITEWDAPAIAALNRGVTLPHQSIVPIRRADASGDSFIFTQFLDFANQEWEDKVGYGTSVQWPSVAGERTAQGNAQMVQTLAEYAVLDRIRRHQLPRFDCACGLGHRAARESERPLSAADSGDRERRRLDARFAHAPR